MTATLKAPEISRRGVLAGIGGLSFCFAVGVDGARLVSPANAATGDGQISPWVRIKPDGSITILTISEMGQGSGTSVPLILAEEMDADWSKVQLEFAPAEPEVYGYPNGNQKTCRSWAAAR